MSHSQFHCTGRVYLDLHGLIFETSICYWQDQPGSPWWGGGGDQRRWFVPARVMRRRFPRAGHSVSVRGARGRSGGARVKPSSSPGLGAALIAV